LERGGEKVLTFLNNISQTKTSHWGIKKGIFHHLRQQKGGGEVKNVLKGVYIW
jgi:hypothetical protein